MTFQVGDRVLLPAQEGEIDYVYPGQYRVKLGKGYLYIPIVLAPKMLEPVYSDPKFRPGQVVANLADISQQWYVWKNIEGHIRFRQPYSGMSHLRENLPEMLVVVYESSAVDS